MAKRKDDNQRDIEQALRKAGAMVIDCTIAPALGFDLLIAFRGSLYVCEVKNPAQRWTLTDGESKRKFELELKGVSYHVCENATEALKIIGAMK